MIAQLHIEDKPFQVDFSKGISIGIPIELHSDQALAWHAEPVQQTPVEAPGFVGDIRRGGAVNFKRLTLTPHGNGTHTECVAHIMSTPITLKDIHVHPFLSQLISINVTEMHNQNKITKELLEKKILKWPNKAKGLIVRTLPNLERKCQENYSEKDTPFFTPKAIELMNNLGIEHLLVDLPSIDPRQDGGKLLAHKMFWRDAEMRTKKTITEMIYVPCSAKDGLYLTDIQMPKISTDAFVSNPVLYSVIHKNVY